LPESECSATLPPVEHDAIDRLIEGWRRQRPDLDPEPLAVIGRLQRAGAHASGRIDGWLMDHGLEQGWFDLLSALRRAGAPHELTPTQLARSLMLSSGGLTKRLDRMQAVGLIERRPDPRDRRGVLVRLTRTGRSAVDAAVASHLAEEQKLLAVLTQDEREQLAGLLRRLLIAWEGAADDEAPYPLVA
jgi:DNA-binding MarR family transcriptional regulator